MVSQRSDTSAPVANGPPTSREALRVPATHAARRRAFSRTAVIRLAGLLLTLVLAGGTPGYAQGDPLVVEGNKVTVNGELAVTGAITAPDLTEVMKQLKALQARVEVPVGTIMPYGGGGDPTNRAELAKHGWLFCDGALLSQSLDSGLYNAIGTAFGGTKDSFNLPDLRGRFVRGVDDSTGRDPDASARTASNSGGNRDDNVGSVQNDTFKSHTHKYVSPVQWSNNSGNQMEYGGDIRAKQEWETESTGGDETRPKNVYVNWIIKARPSK